MDLQKATYAPLRSDSFSTAFHRSSRDSNRPSISFRNCFRGCATRSDGHTVQMNDPEAESKNAPQEEKIPAWLKWLRWFGILVAGLAITSFLIVVGVVLWVFWIIKDIYDRWP